MNSAKTPIILKSMKRIKTSYQDLREIFKHGITVSHISEKLVSCRADEDAASVKKRMRDLDFDVMGLEKDGAMYGYIRQIELETGLCGEYQHTFRPSELVAESTPLLDILTILRDRTRVFVLTCNRVTGIVTRGDMQKAPVRMFLFGLVTLLEMHLLRLIQIYYPDDSWKEFLTENRLNKAMNLQKEREERKEALDLADCLQFCDKRDLIIRNQKVCDKIGYAPEDLNDLLKKAEKTRDKLDHVQNLVTGTSWEEIIDFTEKMTSLLECCEGVKE